MLIVILYLIQVLDTSAAKLVDDKHYAAEEITARQKLVRHKLWLAAFATQDGWNSS